MEEKKTISPLVVGSFISLILIVFSIVLTVAGGQNDPKGGWISYVIIIGGLMYAIHRHSNNNSQRLSFGELFQYGFKATTMMVLIFVVFLFAVSFIMPEMKQKVVEATRIEMEKQGKFSDADIKSAIQNVNQYFWIIVIGTTMFFFVLIGCIGSLLGAAISKKKSTSSFDSTVS